MTDWQGRILRALRGDRVDPDDSPDWRAALSLHEGLGPAEARSLDAALLRMIDEDYRNPHSSREAEPFDQVLAGLPAGMAPDDLLCVEAAVLVASERGLGRGYFALNRLLRGPRWHALYPRLHWLSRELPGAQARLSQTPEGRIAGAMLGLAVGAALRRSPEGPIAGEPGPAASGALALARALCQGPVSAAAVSVWGSQADLSAWLVPAGLVFGSDTVSTGRLGDALWPGLRLSAAQETFQVTQAALVAGTGVDTLGELWQRQAAEGPADGPEAKAVWCLATGSSMEDCLVRALNTGEPGVAVLAGALAGARFGPLAPPRKWTAHLPGRAAFEEAAEALGSTEFSPGGIQLK